MKARGPEHHRTEGQLGKNRSGGRTYNTCLDIYYVFLNETIPTSTVHASPPILVSVFNQHLCWNCSEVIIVLML
jgi:hypothetical protein